MPLRREYASLHGEVSSVSMPVTGSSWFCCGGNAYSCKLCLRRGIVAVVVSSLMCLKLDLKLVFIRMRER